MAGEGDSLRASDLDREFVVDQLRTSFQEGRLTLPEFDERVRSAYAARTYGDLKFLLADLPALVPVPVDPEAARVAGAAPDPRRGLIIAVSVLLIIVILGVALSGGLSVILGL